VTETQHRFLKAIAERIPEDRIVEVRLFPAIRQGGVESGVAIVATETVEEPADAGPAAESSTEDGGTRAPDVDESAEEAVGDDDADPDVEATDDEPAESDVEDVIVVAEAARVVELAPEGAAELAVHVTTSVIAPDVVASSHRRRYEVHSARYRLVLKGPDRGKWEFDLVHQADAPLDTVERVVRGVAHRAGEQGEAETFTSAELRTALAQPWWNTEP
jgi:hypothetical protein